MKTEYSKKVMDHWLHPRNPGDLADANGYGRLKGTCGDAMEIFIHVSSDYKITNASFMTDGCTTTIATGSVAVDLAIGRSIQSAKRISQKVILETLEGLPEESEHCALLAADTLKAAIDNYLIMRDLPGKGIYHSARGNRR
ncbi:MAG: iron-sulfur cluster assembly scaffold protein [Deltaproteobacteria bacterium]|nr:iron-sulfur cluster assembly scaffold protein [Deltaproteobacteria bacterium]